MTLATDLRAVRALIDTPEKFCKGAFAKTKTGYPIGPDCANAVCFCVVGAIIKTGIKANDPIYAAIKREIDDQYVVVWADDPATTHADVLVVLDRAIAQAEAGGG